MLDKGMLQLCNQPLQRLAQGCVRLGIPANGMTWFGFLLGLSALPLLATHHYEWAMGSMLLNRLADGLDGEIARLTTPTDRGAFLDISLDFLFYSAVPLGFALADPEQNALAASVLIYTFVGTGSTFLAFAMIAEKRQLMSTRYPAKGFYYLGGLTEATETMACFVLMCLWPAYFSWFAYGFALLCSFTVISRLAAGWSSFADPKEKKASQRRYGQD